MTRTASTPDRSDQCPICSHDVAGSSALPFCSERCRTVDLGNWLGEAYRIPMLDDSPVDEPAGDDDDDESA